MVDVIAKIAEQLKNDQPVQSVTVRTFLSWFNAERRGFNIVHWIRQQLNEAGIVTVPDFEATWIDGPITFALQPTSEKDSTAEFSAGSTGFSSQEKEADPVGTAWTKTDATYRVVKLSAANKPIVSITPNRTIEEVLTLLMSGNFSQLPVMTSERELKGMITWKSIGCRLGLGRQPRFAQDLMDIAYEVKSNTSIFEAIPGIIGNDYVLVRDEQNKISGIITSSDLSLQFLLLTEPFLLLSEIENLVRNLIGDHFSKTELHACLNPSEHNDTRNVEKISDLTFGEYIRLLESPENWARLKLAIDRVTFCKDLDRVRQIRACLQLSQPDG